MSNGTFTIPELRCQKHFYSSILVERQAQAPVNEGIVAVDPCEECLEALRRDNAALREALQLCVNDLDEWYQSEIVNGTAPDTGTKSAIDTARAALRQADDAS